MGDLGELEWGGSWGASCTCKRGHVHDHGRVLRTCEVGGVAGLELGMQHLFSIACLLVCLTVFQ